MKNNGNKVFLRKLFTIAMCVIYLVINCFAHQKSINMQY